MSAATPRVAGLWLDGTPSRWAPLAAVAPADGGTPRSLLLVPVERQHLTAVGAHPTTAAVAPQVLARLRDWTLAHLHGAGLVVVGGYRGTDSVSNPYLHGELHGAVRLALHDAGVPAAVVRPVLLFRYAGGSAYDHYKARAAAEVVFGAAAGAADADAWALWLRAMGLDRLGAPVADRPAGQRRALPGVDWPAPPAGGWSR